MKFDKEGAANAEVPVIANEQEIIADLSNLELSLVGGGQGEVTLF